MATDVTPPPRPLPDINPMNEYFWRGGKRGKLCILRCGDCSLYIHPYAGRCPRCRSHQVAPEPVSGRGSVAGFTVNFQRWVADVEVPYIIALIELQEQADIRLLTNMPRCRPEEVEVGMPVQVYFERQGDVYVPLFERAGQSS